MMKKYFSEKFIFPWGYNPWSPRRTPLRASPELLVVGAGEVFFGANLDNFGLARWPKMVHISKMEQIPTTDFLYVQAHTLKKLWWNFQLNRSWSDGTPLKPFVTNLAWDHLHMNVHILRQAWGKWLTYWVLSWYWLYAHTKLLFGPMELEIGE